jgi:hypothetical protein
MTTIAIVWFALAWGLVRFVKVASRRPYLGAGE